MSIVVAQLAPMAKSLANDARHRQANASIGESAVNRIVSTKNTAPRP